MKTYRFFTVLFAAVLLLSACDKYLDVVPDNRTELDSEDKITSLLVSAYPSASLYMHEEYASDNVKDNGDTFPVEDKDLEEVYLWQPVYTESNDDSKSIWDDGFSVIAAANQALSAIDDLGNPSSLSAQRGEALICRAFSYFRLANIFCLAYDDATADKVLGLPYNTKPETTVKPIYTRGTLKELYEHINADIEEALPLIDDNIYNVPKYHFNKKAAYAFASRFNLYYHKLDKVIEYATIALGPDPKKNMRDLLSINNAPMDIQVRINMYNSASDPGNFLIHTAYSSFGVQFGNYSAYERYALAKDIFEKENLRAEGLWGKYSNLYNSAAGGSSQKMYFCKITSYFEYVDKQAGIGYLHTVNVPFSGDETLLCRAEAYARKGDLASAVADINTWIYTHTTKKTPFTQKQIVDFYSKIKCMPLHVTQASDRTVKKEIHPVGFSISEGDQLEIINCILHLRRVETLGEGLRWEDIKRYGIVYAHNRYGKEDDVLELDDPRRAFQIPADVIDAGLEKNPR